jgi:beta-galactosidase
MTINIRYLLGIALLFSFSVISAQVRTSYTFEKGWKFTREDNADFKANLLTLRFNLNL